MKENLPNSLFFDLDEPRRDDVEQVFYFGGC